MPVLRTEQHPAANSLTFVAEWAAPVERVWQLYTDLRQLERVWGPPGYPATFEGERLVPGERVSYFMTGPNGERYPGYWDVLELDEPSKIVVRDGFAEEDGTPQEGSPLATMTIAFAPTASGTRATYDTAYGTPEELARVLEMGAIEGTTLALNQIDDALKG